MPKRTRRILKPAVLESELQDAIIEVAHVLGYRVAHFRGVRIQRRDGSVYYQTPLNVMMIHVMTNYFKHVVNIRHMVVDTLCLMQINIVIMRQVLNIKLRL